MHLDEWKWKKYQHYYSDAHYHYYVSYLYREKEEGC